MSRGSFCVFDFDFFASMPGHMRACPVVFAITTVNSAPSVPVPSRVTTAHDCAVVGMIPSRLGCGIKRSFYSHRQVYYFIITCVGVGTCLLHQEYYFIIFCTVCCVKTTGLHRSCNILHQDSFFIIFSFWKNEHRSKSVQPLPETDSEGLCRGRMAMTPWV